MQLNISTDYAIRAMLFLTLYPHTANATEISSGMNIPINTCKKNLMLLKNAGLVTTFAGVNGGYALARSPENICLADILRAVGEKMEVNRCLAPDGFCNRQATETCPVHDVYKKVQKSIDDAFGTSLYELANSANG